MIESVFSLPVKTPKYQEEAATGAALFAAQVLGVFSSVFEAQKKDSV